MPDVFYHQLIVTTLLVVSGTMEINQCFGFVPLVDGEIGATLTRVTKGIFHSGVVFVYILVISEFRHILSKEVETLKQRLCHSTHLVDHIV